MYMCLCFHTSIPIPPFLFTYLYSSILMLPFLFVCSYSILAFLCFYTSIPILPFLHSYSSILINSFFHSYSLVPQCSFSCDDSPFSSGINITVQSNTEAYVTWSSSFGDDDPETEYVLQYRVKDSGVSFMEEGQVSITWLLQSCHVIVTWSYCY